MFSIVFYERLIHTMLLVNLVSSLLRDFNWGLFSSILQSNNQKFQNESIGYWKQAVAVKIMIDQLILSLLESSKLKPMAKDY